jgi:hypothetical protein
VTLRHLVVFFGGHYVVGNNAGIDLWLTPHHQATKNESHPKR